MAAADSALGAADPLGCDILCQDRRAGVRQRAGVGVWIRDDRADEGRGKALVWNSWEIKSSFFFFQ